MAVPTIKALSSLGDVDVLVGSGHDDGGAADVMRNLAPRIVRRVFFNSVPLDNQYDVAVLSIPFDGRWQNGVHFSAKMTMDGRTRPDPSTTGLSSWKKHEAEYQFDNALELGYLADMPDLMFYPSWVPDPESIYLGIGYKKDELGFWKKKHWGNENYSALVLRILSETGSVIHTTGDLLDLQMTIKPILASLPVNVRHRLIVHQGSLDAAFRTVTGCAMYVGNDTGMMHVAASADRKVCGLFFLENSIVKNGPLCKQKRCLDGFARDLSVDEVFSAVMELRNERPSFQSA